MCSILPFVGLVAAFVAACASAILLLSLGGALPAPWGAVSLAGAVGAAGAAYLLRVAMESAFEAYVVCRDRRGPSRCRRESVDKHFTALTVLLGVVIGACATALLAELIPFVGDFLGAVPISVAIGALILIIATAGSLVMFVDLYRRCRDGDEPSG